MYLASVINETLESRKSKLLGRSSYQYITRILNRAFNKVDPYRFKYELCPGYKKGDFTVSGLYDMNKDVRYVILNFPKRCQYFYVDDQNWNNFKFAISQVCQHESIHQIQWQKRDVDYTDLKPLEFRSEDNLDLEDRKYLSDVDEVDAYAHDIAMEIRYFYPDKDPKKILSNIDHYKKLWSYFYYKDTFRNTDWSNIKNRLLKKTYQWLPQTVA